MYQTQLAITEIKNFIRRRKVILILAPALLLSLSVSAAYMLPPKYESSITILVERDETLNPMIQYTMAVAMASEDRLRSFNEIVYSRATINMLIDSLGLAPEHLERGERDELIRQVRSDIRTNLRASDSFSISYLNEDPEDAQKGVKLLSDHFIETKLSLENKRNEQTVEFFENKLDTLEQAVNEREERMMAQMQRDIEQTPRENRSLQTDLDRVESNMTEVDRNISRMERSLEVLRDISRGNRELEAIRELNLAALPSGSDMRDFLNRYRSYSQRYTSQYPQLKELEGTIYDLTERMVAEVEAELFEMQQELAFLQDQRSEMVRQLEQTAVTQQSRSGARSDYEVYKKMLDDMKVKVEQARSTRELGDRAQNQFVVIDEANIPEKPAKPNKTIMVAGGLMIGVFLGVVGAGVAELLDTTIRRPEDLKEFETPVIAFIPGNKAS